jgi:hypothetical protein
MDTHNDGIHGGEGSGEFLCFIALLPLAPSKCVLNKNSLL